MGFNQSMVIRAVRLSLTCIILFLITWYYQVPESAWCLITVWFVMYEYTTVGGVFTKGVYRFTGTLLSALYGMLIIYFCQNNIIINVLALTPAVLLYSYYFMDGDKAYIAIIGSVTLTIVLLNYNRIDLAILRTFNIILGVAGSMVMIRLFYPQYARDSLIETQSQCIGALSQMLSNYLDPSLSLVDIKTTYTQCERNMAGQTSVFHRLAHEAKIETSKTPLYIPYHNAAFEHIGHIFRLMSVFINYLTTEDIRLDPRIKNHVHMLLFNLNAIQATLETNVAANQSSTQQTDTIIQAEITKDKAIKLAEILLHNIADEITLLAENINKIIVIYERYKTTPLDVSNR